MADQIEKVIGTIGAMGTLIENFPMSIFESTKPIDVRSAFNLIFKILAACGIDTKEIIERVLEKIFGVEVDIQGGIEDIYQTIRDLDIDEQSKFMNAVEYGVKGVLMSLLSSIFTCSANPILPDKYMDVGSIKFNGHASLQNVIFNSDKLQFPTRSFDLFDILNVNPFSNEGQLYYKVEGGDVFYEKKEYVTQQCTEHGDTSETRNMPAYALYFDFGEGHDEYVQKTLAMTHGQGLNEFVTDTLNLKISHPVKEDILIDIEYSINGPTTGFPNGPQCFQVIIPKGETESESFELTPFYYGYNSNGSGITGALLSMEITSTSALTDGWRINGSSNINNTQCIAGDEFVYLDYEKCKPVINFWNSRSNASMQSILDSIKGDENASPGLIRDIDPGEIVCESASTFYYELMEKRPQSKYGEIPTYTAVPSSATSNNPKIIKVHTGYTETDLYKTNDMNAFLWYVINKSRPYPQVEYNKTMWDSRLYSSKKDYKRDTPELWNNWYNSKQLGTSEFNLYDTNPRLFGDRDTQNRILYPIIQCNRTYPYASGIEVLISSQKYFKPKAEPTTDNNFTYTYLRLNKTIYEFNWEYLENIQIFKPKIILFGMFDTLLNGALSIAMGIKQNFKREEVKAKISKSITKYIEALDTEVEDCYFTFSNDEFNEMLEDMLLSKYNATRTPGNNPTIKQHDMSEYFDSINSINPSASQSGTIDKIMKTISEVSATKGEDGYIEYGINLGEDDSWWKAIIQSIAMALIESILTPQVVLLIMMNFEIMGVTSLDDLITFDIEKLIGLVIKKILSLIKSIIVFLKDKLLEILMELVYEYVIPLISEYMLLIALEKVQQWIDLLNDTLDCLAIFNISVKKQFNQIDDVNYADIETPQIIPESSENC